MLLTMDEIEKIDVALETLGESFEDELHRFPSSDYRTLDDPFLKKLVPDYFSAEGAMMLVADSQLVNKQSGDCVCGCSCAEPQKGPVTL